MHLNHQNDTRRIRLDLTVSAAKHHQNHFTTTSFRRSSETVEPPPKPSQFFQLYLPVGEHHLSLRAHPTRPTLHRFNTRATNKNHPIQNRTPNLKNHK
ncbi:hypothetical protein HID58_017749 [Brassica napus]|uniref:Uncharacterized protein n=1 Tax=Brassica napus TaxID=3708 RepID=A0ABQ8D9R6_BRANA|nr:hypothetical protein HID58_017749 [Brassica napus]